MSDQPDLDKIRRRIAAGATTGVNFSQPKAGYEQVVVHYVHDAKALLAEVEKWRGIADQLAGSLEWIMDIPPSVPAMDQAHDCLARYREAVG